MSDYCVYVYIYMYIYVMLLQFIVLVSHCEKQNYCTVWSHSAE